MELLYVLNNKIIILQEIILTTQDISDNIDHKWLCLKVFTLHIEHT